MANKKFVIKSFKPGSKDHKHINPLINLSSLGISENTNITKTALGLSATLTQSGPMQDLYYPTMYDATGLNLFAKYRDLTKNQTNNYAYFDMSYQQRRMYCLQLSRDGLINAVLDCICNEAIVPDENGYIALLDLDKLKLFLNKGYTNKESNTNADKLIKDCKIAYNIIYSALGWDDNNGAFQYFKRFLIEGFLTFEILFDEAHKNVVGFLELDPITLQPDIIKTESGEELFIWYQYKGESRLRIIPDSNLIYISWNSRKSSRETNISYVESLTRSYNVLKQLENSQTIWNIQNAQKRMKITVPVGNMTTAKAQERINELMAEYTEEVTIDDLSGQVLVNGEPKYSFLKTYFFEDRDGKAVQMEAVETAGNDLSVETLQYYWRLFILDTQVPANRFLLNVTAGPSNPMLGDANVTREEYAFGRFIQRIRSMFKEILIKPLWTQICLKHPELSYTNYLKQGLGIKFNEENLFTLAKERSLMSEGAGAVGTLMGINGTDGKPYFSIEYAIKKYLGLSDAELEINAKYKEAEVLQALETEKIQKELQAAAQAAGGGSGPEGGGDMGGGDFGGGEAGGFGADTGGGDMGFGADTGGGDVMSGGEFGAEPAATEAPADTGGGEEGGF